MKISGALSWTEQMYFFLKHSTLSKVKGAASNFGTSTVNLKRNDDYFQIGFPDTLILFAIGQTNSQCCNIQLGIGGHILVVSHDPVSSTTVQKFG